MGVPVRSLLQQAKEKQGWHRLEEWQWRRGQACFEKSLLNQQDLPIVQTGGERQEEKVGSRRICQKMPPKFLACLTGCHS